ncbi:PTS transporter subunit IIC [Gelidibacter gilvus]|uniref:PTS sugar transporter subunit IIC n=1 Tax=Gelidibacter gilvus TaxID=59602 RepID=A0A4Q0XED2_9FLAO|nr:PTS sugar transporter subunit IIC [Gelidibacter gilvus]RXJ49584.1 PTS sugar transporter subunit IIC [Gelidibacter gilvus]
MISYLKSKGISLSPHDYFVNALSFMALGLFASLLMGLILETMGKALGLEPLVEMGQFAKDPKLVGAAIGVAVAYSLKAPPLILFSAVVAGAFGGALGGPAGSYVTVLIATEVGKIAYKLTKVDIIIVPMTVLLMGYAIGSFIGIPINQLMQSLGTFVNWSTQQQPYLMSMLVATVMGLALTAPISSAAIAFMLGIDGLAAGAAVVGCAAQMVGFASISFKENGMGGWIAQGLGTSMLQIGNVIKNPWILVAPTLAGLLTAPLAVGVFQMKNNAAGAGMGTSGLVGQFMAFDTMGFSWTTFTLVLVFHILLPIGLSVLFATYLRRKGKIKPGDLKLIYE